MGTSVRAALLQTDWTGDRGSMIDKHEAAAREAAAQARSTGWASSRPDAYHDVVAD